MLKINEQIFDFFAAYSSGFYNKNKLKSVFLITLSFIM